jgi:hypothetical protein
MLLQKLKIDIDKINKRNQELIETKWIDKLNNKQKKFLNWRKKQPSLMNRDGLFSFTDLSSYLLNPDKFSEININNLRNYLSIYEYKQKWGVILLENINDDFKKILQEIQKQRVKSVQKYIKIEDSIFRQGIYSNDTIYRTQEEPIIGNIIKNTTSWSLAPIENFCNKKECHLYVTKIPKKLKVLYLENNSKDKNLNNFQDFTMYEYEYLLPRNLEFIEYKTKKYKIINNMYNNKNLDMNFIDKIFIVHYIKITNKVKNIEFPKINKINLVYNF